MSRALKVLLFGITIFGVAIFAASCGSSKAQYRIFNAIANPINQPVDIYFGGSTTPTYSSVSFATTEPASGYAELSSGTGMEVFQSGQQVNAWINSSLNLGSGNQYTVLLSGNSTTSGAAYPYAAQVFQDQNPSVTVTPGDAEFRFIDASISAGAVDVFVLPSNVPCCPVNITPSAKGLSYLNNNTSGYVNVGIPTSGEVTVYMIVSGTENNPVQVGQGFPDTVAAGAVHTLIIADQNGGGYPPQMFPLATN